MCQYLNATEYHRLGPRRAVDSFARLFFLFLSSMISFFNTSEICAYPFMCHLPIVFFIPIFIDKFFQHSEICTYSFMYHLSIFFTKQNFFYISGCPTLCTHRVGSGTPGTRPVSHLIRFNSDLGYALSRQMSLIIFFFYSCLEQMKEATPLYIFFSPVYHSVCRLSLTAPTVMFYVTSRSLKRKYRGCQGGL